MVVPLEHRPRSGPYSGLNYRSAKRFLARQFDAAALPFAQEDALDLVLGLTGLTHTDYLVKGTDFITPEQFEALQIAADRRLAGEPVDRILGWRDFYGRRFGIDGVLSPRGDTEVLLLAVLDVLQGIDAPRLLDLGTGSGALAISVLCERPNALAVATDRDVAALKTAQVNAKRHGVADRLTLLTSDWFEAIPPARFDAVISNPPYITTAAIAALETEVSEHDPVGALHGGVDGLDPYRILMPGAGDYLVAGGWLGVEIGYDQREAVMGLLKRHGYATCQGLRDPAGRDRVVCGRLAATKSA